MNRMSWRDYSRWTRAVTVALLCVLLVLMLLVATAGFRWGLWFIFAVPAVSLILAHTVLLWRDYRRKSGTWPRPNTDRLRQYRDPRWIAVLLLAAAAGVILGLLS